MNFWRHFWIPGRISESPEEFQKLCKNDWKHIREEFLEQSVQDFHKDFFLRNFGTYLLWEEFLKRSLENIFNLNQVWFSQRTSKQFLLNFLNKISENLPKDIFLHSIKELKESLDEFLKKTSEIYKKFFEECWIFRKKPLCNPWTRLPWRTF